MSRGVWADMLPSCLGLQIVAVKTFWKKIIFSLAMGGKNVSVCWQEFCLKRPRFTKSCKCTLAGLRGCRPGEEAGCFFSKKKTRKHGAHNIAWQLGHSPYQKKVMLVMFSEWCLRQREKLSQFPKAKSAGYFWHFAQYELFLAGILPSKQTRTLEDFSTGSPQANTSN